VQTVSATFIKALNASWIAGTVEGEAEDFNLEIVLLSHH
jgi:phage shock protein PspC (stress-responsive transcriptional regulator)